MLAPRWHKWDMFMWLHCLSCSLNLSQGLPKNNCYWIEKWRWAGTKSTVYSTTTSATYCHFVTKWRWKHQPCCEGKMRVNLFPPEPPWTKPPFPHAPHPGGVSSTPAPLPSSSASCCFVAKAKSAEQISVVWSDPCALVVLVLANTCCKTARCMR